MSFAFGGGGGTAAAPDDKQTNIEESTPWMAASDGDLALLQTALSKLGLPPTVADTNGFTFVHAAAAYCRTDVLRWLFQQDGIDVNKLDVDGDTPLHHCDDPEAARILVEEGGVDPSVKNAEGKTAREAKEEELREEEEDNDGENDDDSDDEDRTKLKALIQYLRSLEDNVDDKDEVMQ